jgi:hypothetical protein
MRAVVVEQLALTHEKKMAAGVEEQMPLLTLTPDKKKMVLLSMMHPVMLSLVADAARAEDLMPWPTLSSLMVGFEAVTFDRQQSHVGKVHCCGGGCGCGHGYA